MQRIILVFFCNKKKIDFTHSIVFYVHNLIQAGSGVEGRYELPSHENAF